MTPSERLDTFCHEHSWEKRQRWDDEQGSHVILYFEETEDEVEIVGPTEYDMVVNAERVARSIMEEHDRAWAEAFDRAGHGAV